MWTPQHEMVLKGQALREAAGLAEVLNTMARPGVARQPNEIVSCIALWPEMVREFAILSRFLQECALSGRDVRVG